MAGFPFSFSTWTTHSLKGQQVRDSDYLCKKQKVTLYAFVQYGDIPISNNLAENAIRPFAVGLKNWLFCDTVKGTKSSAIMYSLVETAKATGIDPYNFLFYVLSRLPYFGKSVSLERLTTLIPWANEVQQRYSKEA